MILPGAKCVMLISLAKKFIAMVNAQLYTDLLQREKELEILSGARVQAQEDERRRIAREITRRSRPDADSYQIQS